MLPQIYSHENSKHDNLDEWNCRFWGVCCESGKKYSQVVSKRFKLTMAALDPESYKGGSPYVSVVLERDGAEYLLCSLKHEHILQVNLNLVFEKGQNVTFALKGDGIVHLSGYQDGNCVKLSVTDQKDHSGNAESNPSMLGKVMRNGRIFCEICDIFIKSETVWGEHIKKKKHKKNTEEFMRSRFLNSNPIVEVKASPSKNENPVIDLEEGSGKKGKSSSSLKNDVRNMPSTSKDEDSEDSSEIEELPSSLPSSSKKVGTSGFKVESLLSKNLVKTLNEITDDEDDEEDEDFNVLDAEEESDYDEEDSDDDDEEDDDDSDDSDNITINKTLEAQKRKRELEASGSKKRVRNNSFSEASTSEVSQKPIEIFEVDDKESSSSSEEESDSSMDTSSTFKKSPLLKKEQVFSKKRKISDGVNQLDTNSISNLSSSKANDTVQIQDVRPGYGPPAKAGKMVQVYYVGKFPDGKIFDQTENGKPFSFKLGAGQVIKGWDTGIEGMKVGGKRILKIPPSMGYGSQATDDIPANSTLVFHVELKSIS